MSGLFGARNTEIALVACGILAIILTTIFTARITVNHLRETDVRMNELNAQLAIGRIS